WDQEVHDFIGESIALLSGTPSFRTYTTAAQFKAAGLDWKAMILSRWKLPASKAAVVLLKADSSFESEEARVNAFVADKHGCRATYFNIAKTLKGKVSTATQLIVTGSAPTLPIPVTTVAETITPAPMASAA
ncbi:MAG: hypothetical protein K8U57_40730, partial [Planctomycetes bacterium]|nr:hypothetical protein [Planctomycetota bacterium]